MVPFAYTIIYPGAMVIHFIDTAFAYGAVMSSLWPGGLTPPAHESLLSLNLHLVVDVPAQWHCPWVSERRSNVTDQTHNRDQVEEDDIDHIVNGTVQRSEDDPTHHQVGKQHI